MFLENILGLWPSFPPSPRGELCLSLAFSLIFLRLILGIDFASLPPTFVGIGLVTDIELFKGLAGPFLILMTLSFFTPSCVLWYECRSGLSRGLSRSARFIGFFFLTCTVFVFPKFFVSPIPIFEFAARPNNGAGFGVGADTFFFANSLFIPATKAMFFVFGGGLGLGW